MIASARVLVALNVPRWIAQRVAKTSRLADTAARAGEWSRADLVPTDHDSADFREYRSRLKVLTERYFPQGDSDFYLVVVRRGIEFRLDPFDQHYLDKFDKANAPELRALSSGMPASTDVPLSDNYGTYVATYVPIRRHGTVVALMAAETDSSSFRELEAFASDLFWQSLVPALILSLLVAAVLSRLFVTPMEVFQDIEAAAQAAKGEDPLKGLSNRQREIADLVRRGLSSKEIAETLHVTTETVKSHLSDIKKKTGWNGKQLAANAAVARMRADSEAS